MEMDFLSGKTTIACFGYFSFSFSEHVPVGLSLDPLPVMWDPPEIKPSDADNAQLWSVSQG